MEAMLLVLPSTRQHPPSLTVTRHTNLPQISPTCRGSSSSSSLCMQSLHFPPSLRSSPVLPLPSSPHPLPRQHHCQTLNVRPLLLSWLEATLWVQCTRLCPSLCRAVQLQHQQQLRQQQHRPDSHSLLPGSFLSHTHSCHPLHLQGCSPPTPPLPITSWLCPCIMPFSQ